MVRFLSGATASEVYIDAIEHKVGRELTSVTRDCRGQMSVQWTLSNVTCERFQKKTNHTVSLLLTAIILKFEIRFGPS